MSMSSRQTPDGSRPRKHTLEQVLKTRAVVNSPLQDAMSPDLLDDIWHKNHESPLKCIGASEFVIQWLKQEDILQFTILMDPAVARPALVRLKTAITAKLAALWPQALPLRIDQANGPAKNWNVRTANATMVTTEQFIAWADVVTREFIAENNYVSLDRKEINSQGILLASVVKYRICRKMEVRPTNLLLSSNDRKYFKALS